MQSNVCLAGNKYTIPTYLKFRLFLNLAATVFRVAKIYILLWRMEKSGERFVQRRQRPQVRKTQSFSAVVLRTGQEEL